MSPNESREQPLPRNLPRAFGAAVVATGVYAAWLGWQIGGEKSVLYFSDAGTILASFLACAACIRAATRHKDRMRGFWWLLGAACGAWMLGEVIWTVYDVTGSGGPPIPSLADVGYLAFIPLAVGALLCHPGLQGSGVRKARSVFDGLAIAVALLFLSWTFVLEPLWRSTDLTTLGGVVTFAYPFGDVVIAFFVLLALRRMGTGDRLGLWCIFAGLIALAVADSSYAYVVEVKSYSSGNLLDTGWFAAFLGIALGARASNMRDLHVRAESSVLSLPSLVAPLLPVFIALNIAAISIKLGHRPDRVGVTMLIALIVLALARQVLLVLDVARAGAGEQQGNLIERIVRAALGRPIAAAERSEP